jgi:chemotaxis protein histidine kinase CheA
MPPASIPAAPDASPREELFRRIKDAAAPTTDLAHLAEAIDGLPAPPEGPKPPPEAPGEPAGPGQAPPWQPDSALDHAGGPDDYSGELGGLVEPIEPIEPLGQVGRVIVDPAPEGLAEPPERPMVIRDGPGGPEDAEGAEEAEEAEEAEAAKPPKAPKPPKEPKPPKPPKPPKAAKAAKAGRRPPGRTAVLVVAAVMGAAAVTAALWSLRTFGARRRPPFTLPLDDHQPREAAADKARAPGDKAPAKAPQQAQAKAAEQAPAAAAQQQAPATAQQQAPPVEQAKAQPPPQAQAPQQAQPPPQAPAQPPAKTQAQAKDAQADGARRAPNVSPAARFAAISQGSTAVAIEQGMAYRDRLPKQAWTIRLVVAERGDTLKNCAGALGAGGGGRDVFLTPLRMRDGRLCYQLFLGNFPTRLSAEAELRSLPDLLKRQQPRLMQVADIAAAQ